jgi:hypothetical protein
MSPSGEPFTPGVFCCELIAALDASEGRRRRRKRDTTPDAIGLALKRALLEKAIAEEPAADRFEEWLFEQCIAAGDANGGIHAVARSIFEEWRFAAEVEAFRAWLDAGAPSDDAPRARVAT